jgi:ABC-type phosphate transport system auxiliary subunit
MFIFNHLQEQQLASVKKLSHAEEQLSAVKAQRPGSTVSQKAALQQRLQEATQEVQAAAAAAQKASQQLEIVAAEKDKVQQELQAIRQQLEAAPLAKQHADLYSKLVVSCTSSCMPSFACVC